MSINKDNSTTVAVPYGSNKGSCGDNYGNGVNQGGASGNYLNNK